MKPVPILLGVLAAALASATAQDAPAPEQAATDFIRIDEDEEAARLQTAVTRYEKGDVTVDLIGAVHVADKGYYEKLNERFKQYDSLLFELIGGERLVDGKIPENGEDADLQMKFVRRMTEGMARYLQLAGQMQEIDYSPDNFVHADLTVEQFTRKQEEKGESILGFALAAAQQAENKGVDQPDMAKLLAALLAGNSNGIKLEMIKTLGKGDDQIAALAGNNVIIADRNDACLAVLGNQIEAGKRNLGIFYGAAHFPAMERDLIEMGFKQTDQHWMTAWDVPKPQPKAQPDPEAEPKPAPKKKAA